MLARRAWPGGAHRQPRQKVADWLRGVSNRGRFDSLSCHLHARALRLAGGEYAAGSRVIDGPVFRRSPLSHYNLLMDLTGVYPPIPTPFSPETGAIDLQALASNTDRWLTSRVRGLVVLGSNGEAPLVDEVESDTVIDTVRSRVPTTRLVIAGTGRESTRATVDASRRAAALGVDAVLVRTPSFFKPQMSGQVFVDHYRAVADGSPAPVILYNFTSLTGVTLPVDAVATLAEHPNIIGIKESGPDIGFVSALVDQTPDEFGVLVGSAPTFFASLLSGAVGGILALAAVIPDHCVELFDLVRSQRYDEARLLQNRVSPLARLVTRTHGVPGLKAALDRLGYYGGPPRSPLRPVSAEAISELSGALLELGVPVGGGTPVALLSPEPL